MQLKDIISTLMLSDFYFNLPLWERKREVFRLWALYGASFTGTPEMSRSRQIHLGVSRETLTQV